MCDNLGGASLTRSRQIPSQSESARASNYVQPYNAMLHSRAMKLLCVRACVSLSRVSIYAYTPSSPPLPLITLNNIHAHAYTTERKLHGSLPGRRQRT